MTLQQKPRTMVVGVDYSDTSDLALNQAFELATGEPNVELHVLHAMSPIATPTTHYGARINAEVAVDLTKHTEAKLALFLGKHPDRKAPKRVLCHVRVDEPAREVAQ